MSSTLIMKEIEIQVQFLLVENGMLWPEQLRVSLNHPHLLERGDYSSNVAMLLAKIMKQSPMQIAVTLKKRLEEQGSVHGLCKEISVAAPGFLNITINWQVWERIRSEQAKQTSHAATKVIIEHTSINPNKSAHIGHLRNSCIGDTLSRMLVFAGYQVEVHNYIDDLGNQLADTVVGLLQAPSEGKYERFGDFCWDTYANVNKVYQDNNELLEQRSQVLHALEAGESQTAWLGSLIAERIVREQLEEMKLFAIEYDVLVWESNIVNEGFWTTTFELLKHTDVFHQVTEGKQAGCWVLKYQEEQGEVVQVQDTEHMMDKVLVRSNGILTYTAKDIAYHMWKFGLLDRDFTYKKFLDGLWSTHAGGTRKKIGHADVVINVIDYRQQYPQAVVKQALAALGFTQQANQLKHVSYGVVSLSPETAAGLGIDISSGKHAYAMSGRQGIGIKVAELLAHMEHIIEAKRSRKAGISSRVLAAAAIRYYLLKVHIHTEVVFDLQQATEVSGNSGIYLLYSYARANRVLAKADKLQLIIDPMSIELTDLELQEVELLRHIAYWEETFEAALKQLTPHVICNYAFELASLFSHFYSACPIIKGPAHKLKLRLWLTSRFKETLHQSLHILGLPTPKRM